MSKCHLSIKSITGCYKKEFAKIEKLTKKKFEKEKERVHNLPVCKEEDMVKDLLEEIVSKDSDKIPISEIKKLAKEFTPSTKSKKCLENYKNVKPIGEQNEYQMTRNYIGKKGKTKYFIKEIDVNEMYKNSFTRLKNNIELTKKASRLNVVTQIKDMFVCKDKNNKYKLYIVKEFIEKTELLNEYIKKNILTLEEKKEIRNIIEKCFKNKLLLGYGATRNMLVIKDSKKLRFVLSSLSSATHYKTLLQEKKEQAYDNIEFIMTWKIERKLKDVVLLKMIREKMITYDI